MNFAKTFKNIFLAEHPGAATYESILASGTEILLVLKSDFNYYLCVLLQRRIQNPVKRCLDDCPRAKLPLG